MRPIYYIGFSERDFCKLISLSSKLRSLRFFKAFLIHILFAVHYAQLDPKFKCLLLLAFSFFHYII